MRSDLPALQPAAADSLVQQIVDHLRVAIRQGRYRPGGRLPTIRAAAQQLGVNRATVQEAYRRLAASGLVSATVGRGTVVRAGLAVDGVFSPGAHAAWEQLRSAPQAPSPPAGVAVEASFAELLPDQDSFPVDGFRQALERVLRARGGDLLVYGHPLGNPELRRLLAARAEAAPGEGRSGPHDILVTSGAQQGIDLVLRTFTAPGDSVAVAVPTYHHLFGLLAAHGLELVPLTQGPDGFDLAEVERALARPGVRLLYVMPTFQNPTGRSLDSAQRRALMEVVGRTRVPVLEDEFQRELRFAGEPAPSLRELDPRGLTVTVETFSKGLFPGIRTGWVCASAEVLSRMASLKRVTDLDTSPLLQAALVDFMAAGLLDSYLDDLRAELRRRHAAAQAALARHMPAAASWTQPDGGFVLWVEMPSVDTDRLATTAASRGVLVTPGRLFTPSAAPSAGMRLSLSRAAPERIAHGIEVLADAASELLERSAPSRRRIFL